MMLVDSHTHILDGRFDADRGTVAETLNAEGVAWVLECGDTMDASIRAAALAAGYGAVYAAVGVHPHAAKEWDKDSYGELAALAKQPKVKAIGEIGLDYHYDFSPREAQRDVLRRQMGLARKAGLPVVIHSREATEDTLDILREFPDVRGVMHSFSSSVETMEIVLGMGYFVSFGGMVTFKNAKKVKECAAAAPPDRILIETDCPYLAPEPHRGIRNEPKYVRFVAEKVAELRGVDVEEVARVTRENAERLFGAE